MSLRSKVVESVRWLAIAQLLSQVVRIGVSIYVIRQLENEHMAYVALANTIGGFLEMFGTLGLGAVVVSQRNLTSKDLSNIAGMIILINLGLLILLVSLAGVIATYFRTPELADLLRVMSLGFVSVAIASVPSALLTRDMRFKELSIIQLCASIVGALVSFSLVNLGFEYWSIVVGGLTFIVVRACLIIVVNGGIVVPRFAVTESVQFISFGGFVMFSGIIWYVYTTIDVVIAGRFWSPEVLGVYAVAVQLTVMPLNRLMPILRQVALPAFSHTIADARDKLQSYIAQSLRLSMSVCMPFFFGISCVSAPLVTLLLGPNWEGAALPLTFLCVAAPFRIALELMGPAIIATGNPRHLMMNSISIAVLMIAAFVAVAGNTAEPAALALVWMMLFPILAILSCKGYCKIMGVDFRCLFTSLAKPLIFSIVMWLAVRSSIAVATPYFAVGVVLSGAIILGVFSYVGLILLFDRALFIELRALVAAKR